MQKSYMHGDYQLWLKFHEIFMKSLKVAQNSFWSTRELVLWNCDGASFKNLREQCASAQAKLFSVKDVYIS